MEALLSQENCMTGCTMGTAKSANGTQHLKKKRKKTLEVRSEPIHETSVRFRSDEGGERDYNLIKFYLVI
jgi:hypothetical protein